MTTYRIAVGFTKLYLVNVAAPDKATALEWIAAGWHANAGKHWDHCRMGDAVPVFTVEGWHGCPDGRLADLAHDAVSSEETCKDDLVSTLKR
jgi:hypothetical protein